MRHRRLSFALLCAVAAALALPAIAPAAPPQLWQVPEAGFGTGSGAGELDGPASVAASPVTGNVFVADVGNRRIDEFTAWGVFVKAFGWGVDASNPEEMPQICTSETGCQQGSVGSGAGQLGGSVSGMAFDDAGNLYVVDQQNFRVQKFDPEGNFALTFGGEVNQTTHANVCTAASGDLCGKGKSGTGAGEFSQLTFGGGNRIAVAPDGAVYVGDVDRIQIFDSQGAYQSQIGLPKEGEVTGGAPEGKAKTGSLAFDDAGNLYAGLFNPAGSPLFLAIFKYAASHWSVFAEPTEPHGPFVQDSPPLALATDSAGNVYASAVGHFVYRIFKYDANGTKLIPNKEEEEDRDFEHENNRFGALTEDGDPVEIRGIATSGEACGIPGDGIYASYLRNNSLLVAYGNPPDPAICPPPRNPPAITDQFATSVGSRSAVLRANISSRFWPTTTYRVEYGLEPCSLGGCQATPIRDLNSKSNSAVMTGGVLLSKLQPGTTYHYRFVASTCFESNPANEAECEPGEEATVKGVGGTIGSDGAEATFTTPEEALPVKEDCPNQGFRNGPSSLLSDCRAYEMVSPVDKDGGDIVTLVNVSGYPARLDQSSVSGDRFTFSAFRPFADSQGANTSSQYLSTREEGSSWSTEAISPPIGRSLFATGANVDREYKLFSPDLCQGWFRSDYEADPVLDPDAVTGFANLYRRANCGGGAYEALSTLPPPHRTPPAYRTLEVQGVSADGQTTIYVANDSLPGTGAPEVGANAQLYVRAADGTTRFVCYLPNGSASTQFCSAGNSSNTSGQARRNQLIGALSKDGSKVFFATGGQLYMRTNPTQPQSAVAGSQCTEEEMACTTAIPGAAEFWAASPEGAKVLFKTAADVLRVYNTEEGTATTIASSGFQGVMGQSTDLSRVYFASTAELVPEATSGANNLYFYEEGSGIRFIAVLAGGDVGGGNNPGVQAVTSEPIRRAARVSADGLTAAFASDGQLTGYDNTDVEDGKANNEVFVYRAQANEGGGGLFCVSCDPGGARPTGKVPSVQPWNSEQAAAWIPVWESSLYAANPLSADGSRLFFNSLMPLVSRDTNGRQDVYEWRVGGSRAACVAQGAERYTPSAGGCLSLISSGESSLDSEFIDASPSGRDVFFTTATSLLPQDPGLIDVYDARENGGLPVPAGPPAACEGETCQSPPAPPNDPTPGSATFVGAGNVQEAAGKKARKHKKHHRKRKHKKQSKQKKQNQRHAEHGRKHR